MSAISLPAGYSLRKFRHEASVEDWLFCEVVEFKDKFNLVNHFTKGVMITKSKMHFCGLTLR